MTRCNPVPLPHEPPRIYAEAERLDPKLSSILAGLALHSETIIHERLEYFLRNALKATRDCREEGKCSSEILFVVGAWGLGKTHVVLHELPRVSKSLGVEACITRIPVMDLLLAAEDAVRSGENVTERVYKAILEKLESRCRASSLAILFLDELEALLQAETSLTQRAVLQALLNMLKSISDPSAAGYEELKGRVHVVIAATPEAKNEFVRFAREMGVSGWIIRRENMLELTPLSRLDALLVIEAVLRDYLGIRDPWSVFDRSLVDVAWLVSKGNTGILLKLLDELVHSLYSECTRATGKPCICKCTRTKLLEVLARLPLPTGGSGYTGSIVNRECIEELHKLLSIDHRLADAYAGLLLLQPIDPNDYDALRALVSRCLPACYRVLVYRVGEARLYEALVKAADRIASRATEPTSPTIVKAILSLLTRIGSLAVTVPVEHGSTIHDSDLRFARSMYNVHVNQLYSSVLAEVLEEMGVEAVEAYMASAGSYTMVYTVVAPTLPFVADEETARRVVDEVSEVERSSPETFYSLVAEALALALRAAGYAPSASRGSGRLALSVKQGGLSVRYQVPFAVVTSSATLKPSIDPLIYIRVSIGPSLEVKRAHLLNPTDPLYATLVVDVTLPRNIAFMLAAAAYALQRFQPSIDRDELEKYLQSVIGELVKTGLEYSLAWAARILQQRGALGLVAPEVDDEKKFVSALTMFSLAMDESGVVDLDLLYEFLTTTLMITPYHGRGKEPKWCGIQVPAILRVDIEALKPDEVRRNIDSMVVAIAVSTGLFQAIAGSRLYRLELPPDVRRILLLLEKLGKLDLDVLFSRYILLPSDPDRAARARRRIMALLKFLAAIGRVVLQRNLVAIRDVDVNELKRHVFEAAAKLEESIPQVLAEYAGLLPPGKQQLAKSLAVLVIGKKKQVKVVDVDEISEALEAAMKLAQRGSPHALQTAVQTLNMLQGLLDMLGRKAEYVRARLSGLTDKLRRILDSVERVNGLAKEAGLRVELEPGLDLSPPRIEDIVDEAARLVAAAREGIRSLKKVISDEVYKTYFFFDTCGDATHSPLAYVVDRVYAEYDRRVGGFKRIEKSLEELQSILTMLRYDPEKARLVSEQLGPRVYTGLSSVETLLRDLRQALRVIEERRRSLEERRERAKRLETEASRLLSELLSLRSRVESLARLLESIGVVEPSVERLVDKARRVERALREPLPEQLDDRLAVLEKRVALARSILDELRRVEARLREVVEGVRARAREVYERYSSVVEKMVRFARSSVDVIRGVEEARRLLEDVRMVAEGRKVENVEELEARLREALGRLEGLVERMLEEEIGPNAYRVYRLLEEAEDARLSSIVSSIAAKLGISEEDVIEIIYRLDRSGYIALKLVRSG